MSPWIKWEDWQAGMYRPGLPDPIRVADSYRLLRDPGGFAEVAREMIREWPNAARQNIHNLWTGRNAWLGQASCCYAHGATSIDTRAAWGELTSHEQTAANTVAAAVRAAWEKEERDAQAVLDL